MGVRSFSTRPKRFPAMAGLRAPHGGLAVAMDRNWERGGCAKDHILHIAGGDVHTELCARRLGDP